MVMQQLSIFLKNEPGVLAKTCAALASRLGVKLATAWRMRAALRRAWADSSLKDLLEEVPW